MTVGQFGSALGFEREDPAGLYTLTAVHTADLTFNLGNIDANVVPKKVSFGYAAGDLLTLLSLYNEDGATLDNGVDNDDFDYEVALSYTGIDNLKLSEVDFQNTRPAGCWC